MGNQWLTTSDGGHRCQRRTKRRARKAQSKSPPKLKLSRSLRKKRNLQMTDGDHLALLNPRRKGKRVHLKSPRKLKLSRSLARAPRIVCTCKARDFAYKRSHAN